MTEIDSRYFAADLEATDLLSIVSAHPYLFWGALVVFVVVCAWYGIRHFTKKEEIS